MEASLKPAFFPANAVVVGKARERVDRYLTEYPLLHVQWFAEQVSDRALLMARGSDQQASAMADYQLAIAVSDQQMQRNAILTLVLPCDVFVERITVLVDSYRAQPDIADPIHG